MDPNLCKFIKVMAYAIRGGHCDATSFYAESDSVDSSYQLIEYITKVDSV